MNIYSSQLFRVELCILHALQVTFKISRQLVNGSVFTFGFGSQGQLGLNREIIDTPTELAIKNVKQIECGNFTTLLLLSDHNTVIKYGDN
jgi:alpha-tubulin suppressor-like RCC1 family protein